MTRGQLTRYADVELRVVLPGGVAAVWHTPLSLAALLCRAAPGQWANLWPGVADEQIFHRCGECGAMQALPVSVQARRV